MKLGHCCCSVGYQHLLCFLNTALSGMGIVYQSVSCVMIYNHYLPLILPCVLELFRYLHLSDCGATPGGGGGGGGGGGVAGGSWGAVRVWGGFLGSFA